MGAAFLLLETKNVVQFALLFGTTWFVNALVFAGILLTVLLALLGRAGRREVAQVDEEAALELGIGGPIDVDVDPAVERLSRELVEVGRRDVNRPLLGLHVMDFVDCGHQLVRLAR